MGGRAHSEQLPHTALILPLSLQGRMQNPGREAANVKGPGWQPLSPLSPQHSIPEAERPPDGRDVPCFFPCPSSNLDKLPVTCLELQACIEGQAVARTQS